MNQRRRIVVTGGTAVAVLGVALLVGARGRGDAEDAPAAAGAPAVLSVAVALPEARSLATRVPATGQVAAWQEATIGAESDGLRVTRVVVNVGDVVRRGDLLAEFDRAIVAAELGEASAAVAQASAESDEAASNARRARALAGSGALSAQQIEQAQVAAASAAARVAAARAQQDRHRVRLAQTQVRAPDDGVVTARTATVGAVVGAGDELFRVIRDGRLEWRASVAMADLAQLAPGQPAVIALRDGGTVRGRVRMVAPTIDAATHDGLVYIDLPREATLRAGAFARGHVEVGDRSAITVPRAAVLLRDGFSYVGRVGDGSKVALRKVEVGQRAGDRVAVTRGLAIDEPVIVSGLGFLADGDAVRVVDDARAPAAVARAAPVAGTTVDAAP